MSQFPIIGKSELHLIQALFACAAALLLSVPTVHATAIVASRSPTLILIGADSKAIRGGDTSDAMFVCKIEQVGRFYYDAAGLTDNPFVNYTLSTIVEEAFRGGKTHTDKINRFEQLVQIPLSRALEYIRRDNPKFFEDYFDRGDKVALEVVFAGVVDGEPSFWTLSFTMEHVNPISVSSTHRSSCPGDCPTGYYTYFIGSKQTMANYALMNPQIREAEPVSAINTLIQVQANSTPNKVGGPIDILFITKDRAQWIQKQAACGELNKGKSPVKESIR